MPKEQTVSKPKRILADVINEVHVYGGLLAIGGGIWLAFGPAIALIVIGTLVFALGVFAIIWSTR